MDIEVTRPGAVGRPTAGGLRRDGHEPRPDDRGVVPDEARRGSQARDGGMTGYGTEYGFAPASRTGARRRIPGPAPAAARAPDVTPPGATATPCQGPPDAHAARRGAAWGASAVAHAAESGIAADHRASGADGRPDGGA